MIIRNATLADIPAIYKLSHSITYNENSKSDSGFLVAEYTEEKYAEFIGHSIFLVAEIDNNIVGFRLALEVGNPAHLQKFTSFNRCTWETVDLRNVEKLIYLAQSGISTDYRRMGIASATLNELFEMYPEHSYFCAIAEKPVLNHASISFFESKGFQRIGYFQPEKYKNISEYMSGRYALIR